MPFTARPTVHAVALMLCASCATPPQRGIDSTPAVATPARDTAGLTMLEREARALVKTGGCETAASCRTAPVGWRGCGGPRAYVVYCPASTDTVALVGKLEALRRAEVDHNERAGVISTCDFRAAPNVVLQGGRCSAAP